MFSIPLIASEKPGITVHKKPLSIYQRLLRCVLFIGVMYFREPAFNAVSDELFFYTEIILQIGDRRFELMGNRRNVRRRSLAICHFGVAMNAGVGWNGRSGTTTYDGIPTHLGVAPGIPMPGLQMITGVTDDCRGCR